MDCERILNFSYGPFLLFTLFKVLNILNVTIFLYLIKVLDCIWLLLSGSPLTFLCQLFFLVLEPFFIGACTVYHSLCSLLIPVLHFSSGSSACSFYPKFRCLVAFWLFKTWFLCSLASPGAHRDPASAYQVLGLKACTNNFACLCSGETC